MSYESLSGPFIPQTNGTNANTTFSSASSSPAFTRFPASGRQHEEELINAFEAEEERILNTLSRKLHQVRFLRVPCLTLSLPLSLSLSISLPFNSILMFGN